MGFNGATPPIKGVLLSKTTHTPQFLSISAHVTWQLNRQQPPKCKRGRPHLNHTSSPQTPHHNQDKEYKTTTAAAAAAAAATAIATVSFNSFLSEAPNDRPQLKMDNHNCRLEKQETNARRAKQMAEKRHRLLELGKIEKSNWTESWFQLSSQCCGV